MGTAKEPENWVPGWRGTVVGAEVRLWGKTGCAKGLESYSVLHEKPWGASEQRRAMI